MILAVDGYNQKIEGSSEEVSSDIEIENLRALLKMGPGLSNSLLRFLRFSYATVQM